MNEGYSMVWIHSLMTYGDITMSSQHFEEKQFVFWHLFRLLHWQCCDKSQHSKYFYNTFTIHLATQSNGNTNTATWYWINKNNTISVLPSRLLFPNICLCISIQLTIRFGGWQNLRALCWTGKPASSHRIKQYYKQMPWNYYGRFKVFALAFTTWQNHRHSDSLPLDFLQINRHPHSNCSEYSQIDITLPCQGSWMNLKTSILLTAWKIEMKYVRHIFCSFYRSLFSNWIEFDPTIESVELFLRLKEISSK